MTAGNGTNVARGMAAARQGAPVFPKRFYQIAAAHPADGGYAVMLDGRAARTPARNGLILPTYGLAGAVAAEWDAIETVIDPRAMPLTRLANSVIDGVSQMAEQVMAETVRFAESDLLLYRAAEPAELVRRQAEFWDPVLAWSRDTFGALFVQVQGVMFAAQPSDSLARFTEGVRGLVGIGPGAPFRLGALNVMTSLTGSVLLAAAIAAGRLSVDQGWSAAHVDEDYQISMWGEDAEATERRQARWAEILAASQVFRFAAD